MKTKILILFAFIVSVVTHVNAQMTPLPTAIDTQYNYHAVGISFNYPSSLLNAYTYQKLDGTFPTNFSFDPISGRLSGTFTERDTSIFYFTVGAISVSTSSLTAYQSYTMTFVNKKYSRTELINLWSRSQRPTFEEVNNTFFNSLDTNNTSSGGGGIGNDSTILPIVNGVLIDGNPLDIYTLKTNSEGNGAVMITSSGESVNKVFESQGTGNKIPFVYMTEIGSAANVLISSENTDIIADQNVNIYGLKGDLNLYGQDNLTLNSDSSIYIEGQERVRIVADFINSGSDSLTHINSGTVGDSLAYINLYGNILDGEGLDQSGAVEIYGSSIYGVSEKAKSLRTNGILNLESIGGSSIGIDSTTLYVNTLEGGFVINASSPINAFLSVSSIIDFSSINAGDSNYSPVVVFGAVVGDPVFVGVDATNGNSNVVFTAYVSSSGTVSVKASNITALPIDPPSGSFTVSILK